MEHWYTRDELLTAKAAMIEAMPGWQMPVAYGLGVFGGSGDQIDWRVTNVRNEHELPAVVLAQVAGYRTGTLGLRLDLPTFDAAIALLAPAGTCDAWEHPNLWAWEALRTEISLGAVPSDADVVVAFVGQEGDDSADPIVESFRRAAGLGWADDHRGSG